MQNRGYLGYILSAVLGAAAGGLVVAYLGKVFPKMMSVMMREMMAHMGGNDCNPAEM